MSKLIQVSINVAFERGRPTSFFYHRERTVERIYDHWREQGRWWHQEQEMHIFKVVSEGSLFELHYVPPLEQWILYRIYD